MSTELPLPDEIGRYRVIRTLGHGAMGRVLLAHDPVLDRDVAIKLLRDDLRLPPEQQAALFDRMRQEARASARVSHPNIVALHDMGEDPDLGLYLVFEYVEGVTLKQSIEKGPLDPESVAKIAREVGNALAIAHNAGVLHRDIKPENMILSRTGAKVADFGIARVPDSTLTRDGGLLGTPAYAAPEAINRGSFSPFSDQFSFAATLYEAVSGLRAFPGDDAISVATLITTKTPAPISGRTGLNPAVDSVLLRAMAKEPNQRFASAEEFGRALSNALGVKPASIPPPRAEIPTLPDRQRIEALESGRDRTRALFAVAGALVGGALTATGFMLLSGSPGPSTAMTALSTSGDPGNDEITAVERPSGSRRRESSRTKSGATDAGTTDAGELRDAGGTTSAAHDGGDSGVSKGPRPAE